MTSTLSVLRGRGVNTLIIVRHTAPLNRVNRSNALVRTRPSNRLVSGVFFGGTPLRSNTLVVHSKQLCTTKYVLPLARGRRVDHRLNAHRHTNINVDRGSSTLIVVLSRRANIVSLTRSNRLGHGFSRSTLMGRLTREVL